MTKPRRILTPTIIDYCKRCSDDDAKSIVAYCCHLSFADRAVRRAEVDFVRAIADQMKISPAETAKMARKVRRRRLRIKKPQSQDARKLLFHLALRMATADHRVDARERSAIDKLAGQLRIPMDIVEAELQKLQGTVTPVPAMPSSQSVETAAAAPPPAKKPKGYFANLFDGLTRNWVVEDLEADLFHPQQHAGKQGEVEYTRTEDGDVELDIELNEINLLPNETVSVIVAGHNVCDIIIPTGRVDRVLRGQGDDVIPRIAIGDSARIQHGGETLLAGTFVAN